MERTALLKPAWRGTSPSRAKLAPSSLAHRAAGWQRALGNRGVERLLQARLKPEPAVRAVDLTPDPAKAPEAIPGLAGIQGLGDGQPLPAATRAFFEPRFGWDFGGVRVHTGSAAAAAARNLRASAFTTGSDIVFAAGAYAPATTAGRSLLAHELAHVVQQAPGRPGPQVGVAQAEREAGAAAAHSGRVPLSARPLAAHRQPAPGAAGMTRDDFARRLRTMLGHDVAIVVGDRERQTRELGGPPARRRLPGDWKAWDPGTSAPLYDEILRAIEDVGREVGGLPDFGQIVFYDVRYDYDDQLNVIAQPNIPAEFRSRGIINVYRAALFETNVVAGGQAISRSGIDLASRRSTPGRRGAIAPMATATRAESQRRTVAHELGHGVEFRTGVLREFEQAVGWVRIRGELRLYDIQASGVKRAIERGSEPPAAARITKADWNSGTHLEQPMREYAVSDSAEDFADSMMAWLYARDTLKDRSPARFAFFDDQARRRGWLPRLVTPGARAAPGQTTP
jgi:hypothetical protein